MQPINVDVALTPGRCREVIARAEALGFAATAGVYPPSYRDNDRLVLDDPLLAAALFERLGPALPARYTDRSGQVWTLSGLNSRFRLCRYRDGQSFCVHRDGPWYHSAAERSWRTFMVYLNDAAEFEGGATRFFASRAGGEVTHRIAPEAGRAVVFDHDAWHDGEAVTAGTKYVLRSDVFYRREGSVEAPGHLGYVWGACPVAGGAATIGRDGTLRRWRFDGNHLKPVSVTSLGGGSPLCITASGDQLVVGSRDGRLRAEGFEVAAHHGAVLALAADAEVVASGGADGELALWTPVGAPIARVQAHRGWVRAVCRTPEGFLTAGEDGRARLWSPAGAPLLTLPAPGPPLWAAACLGDGRYLLGDAEGGIHLVSRARIVASFHHHEGGVRTLAALSPDVWVSGAEDDRVLFWERREPRLLAEHDDFVTAAVPLLGGRILTTSYDGVLRLSGRPTRFGR